ncbi:MAG: hypothetical protein ABEL76_14795, partial [Bradymonadaceae bacterium]
MPTTDAAPAPLDEDSLRALLSERDWYELADRLGYTVRDLELTPEAAETWNIPPSLAEKLEDLRVLAADRDYRLLLAIGDVTHRQFRRA